MIRKTVCLFTILAFLCASLSACDSNKGGGVPLDPPVVGDVASMALFETIVETAQSQCDRWEAEDCTVDTTRPKTGKLVHGSVIPELKPPFWLPGITDDSGPDKVLRCPDMYISDSLASKSRNVNVLGEAARPVSKSSVKVKLNLTKLTSKFTSWVMVGNGALAAGVMPSFMVTFIMWVTTTIITNVVINYMKPPEDKVATMGWGWQINNNSGNYLQVASEVNFNGNDPKEKDHEKEGFRVATLYPSKQTAFFLINNVQASFVKDNYFWYKKSDNPMTPSKNECWSGVSVLPAYLSAGVATGPSHSNIVWGPLSTIFFRYFFEYSNHERSSNYKFYRAYLEADGGVLDVNNYGGYPVSSTYDFEGMNFLEAQQSQEGVYGCQFSVMTDMGPGEPIYYLVRFSDDLLRNAAGNVKIRSGISQKGDGTAPATLAVTSPFAHSWDGDFGPHWAYPQEEDGDVQTINNTFSDFRGNGVDLFVPGGFWVAARRVDPNFAGRLFTLVIDRAGGASGRHCMIDFSFSSDGRLYPEASTCTNPSDSILITSTAEGGKPVRHIEPGTLEDVALSYTEPPAISSDWTIDYLVDGVQTLLGPDDDPYGSGNWTLEQGTWQGRTEAHCYRSPEYVELESDGDTAACMRSKMLYPAFNIGKFEVRFDEYAGTHSDHNFWDMFYCDEKGSCQVFYHSTLPISWRCGSFSTIESPRLFPGIGNSDPFYVKICTGGGPLGRTLALDNILMTIWPKGKSALSEERGTPAGTSGFEGFPSGDEGTLDVRNAGDVEERLLETKASDLPGRTTDGEGDARCPVTAGGDSGEWLYYFVGLARDFLPEAGGRVRVEARRGPSVVALESPFTSSRDGDSVLRWVPLGEEGGAPAVVYSFDDLRDDGANPSARDGFWFATRSASPDFAGEPAFNILVDYGEKEGPICRIPFVFSEDGRPCPEIDGVFDCTNPRDSVLITADDGKSLEDVAPGSLEDVIRSRLGYPAFSHGWTIHLLR